MKKDWTVTFKQPGAMFRGAPFWAWNGKLEPEELRRQIRVMHRMGLGGFFMHARVGLATPYLSDDWFACIDACVDEAQKLKMNAWLYDEDRWPSGTAGGRVTRNPRYRMRSLAVRIATTAAGLQWTPDTLGVFTARLDGAVARNVRAVSRGGPPPRLAKGERGVAFVVQLQPCSDEYNGSAYLDTLNREAVREFIRVTHEAYRQRCGHAFGKTIPGIFTDEPNHGNKLVHDIDTGSPGGLPWTGALPETFRQRYGYDLLPHLMELVFDVEGVTMTPARFHYHDCVTHLYVDAFCRQIGEWCGRNQLWFTGHQLAEDSLSGQTNMVGSCLRAYEHMHAPGMDLLTERWRVFNTAKQVSSAARQFDAKWRLTETYGCTGWDFPFAGHKALGDWQAALGINLRCPHLAWYTMSGQAKRDYPASIFEPSPWWPLYPKVEDYFARVNFVLTLGREVRDILVIHPVESMWMLVKAGWHAGAETHALDSDFNRLTNQLLAAHLDFDFGDEDILARHAKMSVVAGSPSLRIGKARYTVVLAPPMKTMRRSTLELLRRFKQAGGTVVFAGEMASALEGQASGAVRAFAAGCPRIPEVGPGLVAALEESRRLSIAGPAGREIGAAIYLLREDRDAFYLFVCNTGEDLATVAGSAMQQPMVRDRTLAFADVCIRGFAKCSGRPLELNPEDGTMVAAQAVRHGNGWEIATALPALGSRLFVVPKRRSKTAVPRRPAGLKTVRTETLHAAHWRITLSEEPHLVLDRPRYRIAGAPWQAATEILRVDGIVRKVLGIPPRGGAMVQPWARPPPARPKRVSIALAYAFECTKIPSGDLCLAIEEPHTFRVRLNEMPARVTADCGWWVDRSLRKLPLDCAALRLGRNELLLECDYHEAHPGLEIAYLLGRFGTAIQGTTVMMTPLPPTLAIGDWVPQGLAFYSGSVSYHHRLERKPERGERVFLRVPQYRGVAVRVQVNGRTAGVIGWEPNEVEITALLTETADDVAIEVVGHRRNSHGPLHCVEPWPLWTGPEEFTRQDDTWLEGYQQVPCGLMQAPELVFRSRASRPRHDVAPARDEGRRGRGE